VSTSPSPIRVTIVDDFDIVREWLAAHLSACEDMRVVGTASTGAETYRLLAETPPDCLLLDIQLPDCSGVEVARYVRRTRPEIAIVVLTCHDEPAYRSAIARLGVQQFLTKAAPASEIATAIRVAVHLSRGAFLHGMN
jgi:DNA-binding NarL/FixJ family response regulator